LVNAANSKTYAGSKNVSKIIISDNSIDADLGSNNNNSNSSSNKKDNNNMPVEQLTSHMLSSSSRVQASTSSAVIFYLLKLNFDHCVAAQVLAAVSLSLFVSSSHLS
jgi:hypothetical protein